MYHVAISVETADKNVNGDEPRSEKAYSELDDMIRPAIQFLGLCINYEAPFVEHQSRPELTEGSRSLDALLLVDEAPTATRIDLVFPRRTGGR